jgi:transcriptional regulator with XRE-family HTH domain
MILSRISVGNMTTIDAAAPPGTLGGPYIDYQGGSTSNMLLPRIGHALLPPFLSISILATGTSLPASWEMSRPTQSVIAPQTAIQAPPSRAVGDRAGEVLPELARSVRALRQRSGLTWDELARIFGVTRRTLYNWSIGGQVSAAHAQALAQVVALVHEVDLGDPRQTRSLLLAPTESGSTLYSQLIQQQRVKPANRNLEYRADQLLDARFDTPDQTGMIIDVEPLD